jgi:hypothetical protein
MIQCLAGHGHGLPFGHALIAECEKRAEAGYLDALCVEHDQCPQCLSYSIKQLRESIDFYSMWAHTDEDYDLLEEESLEFQRLSQLLNDIDPLFYFANLEAR